MSNQVIGILSVLLLSACAASTPRVPPASTPAPARDVASLATDAASAYAAQDWALSERLYGELTRATPAATEPWFKLGNIYARTDRPDAAVKAFRAAVARDPKHTRAWHNMGVIQLRQATESFSELARVPAPDDPLVGRGRALSDAIPRLIAPTPDEAAAN